MLGPIFRFLEASRAWSMYRVHASAEATRQPMITTASSPVLAHFRGNRYLQSLVAGFGVVWIWAAIDPVYRFDWFLENILTFVAVPSLVMLHRRFPISELSWSLIFAFMCLHTLGSHYTYSEVPVGFWLQDEFDLTRNHYDRFVHFCFGLLLAYPFQEVGLRHGGRTAWFATLAALGFVFAGSASFEIIEMCVALVVDPAAGQAYLGTQGDEWDGQKDMALAAVGALITLSLMLTVERRGIARGARSGG